MGAGKMKFREGDFRIDVPVVSGLGRIFLIRKYKHGKNFVKRQVSTFFCENTEFFVPVKRFLTISAKQKFNN